MERLQGQSAYAVLAAEPFQSYGTSHLVVVAVLLAGLVPAVLIGRRDHSGRISRGFAVVIPCFAIPTQALVFVRDDYDWEATLPLQLCDLAWMAAVLALWTHRLVPVALTYYWGLALTPQAVLTPVLGEDFPDPAFFAFWGQHLLVVWAAVFLIWERRQRPSWAGYRAAVLVTFCWLVAVFVVNAALGTNYGYVNRKPATPSILDFFGPWPVYVVVEIAIVAAVWALMTWPWTMSREPARPGTAGSRDSTG
jgi:hypothetical integral membrane protein (TIGR02206 family)